MQIAVGKLIGSRQVAQGKLCSPMQTLECKQLGSGQGQRKVSSLAQGRHRKVTNFVSTLREKGMLLDKDRQQKASCWLSVEGIDYILLVPGSYTVSMFNILKVLT
jgi:hypothetical protein